MRKNIIYLSSSTIPSHFANSVHVMKMCAALSESNSVRLLCHLKQSGDEKVFRSYGVDKSFELVHCKPFNAPKVGALFSGNRIAKVARQFQDADLVYARNLHSAFFYGNQKPLVFESHGPPQGKLRYTIEKRVFDRPNFKRLVVISAELKKLYLKLFPRMDPSKILIAHDSADDPGVVERLKAQDSLSVGYIGSLQMGRGIELIGDLARRNPDFKFKIAGGTRAQVAQWKSQFTMPNLSFLGFLEQPAMQSLYQKLDIALAPYQATVPTIGWASPMKIFEYMAHQMPIICSDFKVLREVLRDGENALLVPANQPDAWSNALKLLKNGEVRTKLGDQAYKDLKEKFTWKARAQAVLKDLNDEG